MSALVQNSNQIEDPSPKKNGTRMSAAPKPQKSFWTVNRKLLLPSVALMVTLALGLVSYIAYFIVQRNQAEAARDLNRVESSVQGNLTEIQTLSLALASEMASSPQVQAAFASQDRQALQDLTLPIFETVQKDFAVKQYQFILPPATSFLRLHQLDKYDDDLSSFRFTVLAANSTQTPVGGIEIGRGGLGVRGEVPVFYKSKYIGVVDVGIDIGPAFLENLKKQFGVDAQIMLEKNAAQTATFTGATSEISGPTPDLLLQSSTFSEPIYTNPTAYSSALKGEKIISRVTTVNGITYSVISSPLRDYSGNVIGVLDLFINRTDIIAAQSRSLILVIVFSVLATIIGAFVLVRTINSTIRPIGILTETASALAGGDLERQAIVHTNDEFSLLANTFNDMTAQLRNSITTLEQRVVDRTKALSTVAEISTAASTIMETNKLLQEVVDLSKNRFGFYHAHIYLLNEAGDTLVLASGAGEPGRQMIAKGLSIPLEREQSLVARSARERKGITVNDVTQAPDFLPNPLLPDTRSELAVPMIIGENVIGVFDVQSDTVGRFTEADINIQTTLASQIASAVQNARLYSQAELARQEAKSLVDFAAEGIAILDLETELWAEPNENFARTFGMTREEMVRTGPKIMSPPTQPDGRNSVEKAIEMINTAMEKGSHRFEWVHTTAQGTEFDCEIGLVRLPGDHPRLRQSLQDITERKRLQDQVAQRARQQESLNLITQKIQGATTVEAALQIAARELGHTLGMKSTLVTLDPENPTGERKEIVNG
jgi:methyl-accepting chemotaxis protein